MMLLEIPMHGEWGYWRWCEQAERWRWVSYGRVWNNYREITYVLAT